MASQILTVKFFSGTLPLWKSAAVDRVSVYKKSHNSAKKAFRNPVLGDGTPNMLPDENYECKATRTLYEMPFI